MSVTHRTLGAHVTQDTWNAVQYQALLERRSASSLVNEAIRLYLEKVGLQVGSVESLAGQMWLEAVDASDNV